MANKRGKEPVHKIFFICSSYVADESWKGFLEECAYGKFPRGVRFEHGAIKCTRKKQPFVEYVPKDVDKALDVIMSVFRDKLGIKTINEKKDANLAFDKKREEARIQSWKQATTMASKASMIRGFAERFSALHYLSDSEYNELILLIELSITTGILDADNIQVSNGQIESIDGLVFNSFSRKLSIIGMRPKDVIEIHPVPIDYTPVKQTDYSSLYADLLDYHINKIPENRNQEIVGN